MRLHWLLIFASMCNMWGAIQQPHPPNEKWNQCKDVFYKGWTKLRFTLQRASLDYCCRCHEGKCIYIAFSPKLRHMPVFWAYQIDHIGITNLSEQDLLKNVKTWFISLSVVEDLLKWKMHSLPPQVTSRTSPPTTHILSGVFHHKTKYIHKVSNWHGKGYIRWIAYHHTNAKGRSFEGAIVQTSPDKCKWKWLTVKQLFRVLSGVDFFAKPLRIIFNKQKSNEEPSNMNGLAAIPARFPTSEKIVDYNDAAVQCVMPTKLQLKKFTTLIPSPDVKSDKTTLSPERENEKVTETSKTKDEKNTLHMMTGLCSVLIHRTSIGLKRCLERLILDKENNTTSSPHSLSINGKPPDAGSVHRIQSPLESNEIINYRKYVTQKSRKSVQFSFEENEHFYSNNGKLKRTINYYGPTF
ncbi:uncharacterized protein LOC127428629 [Myxocyprinus asiaticus]|uniref:uncharacterized protein LOC127428629 n=1 Tax=Myxocyprinus asiaticus TaxID=70543 RepID=UPI002222AFCF|nr:uncharacterized protein LOC127428629 [Myxocyprinus asiaticus]